MDFISIALQQAARELYPLALRQFGILFDIS